MKIMEKTEFRVLIKHCFLMGKNTGQPKHWLEKCYGNSSPSKTTICRWFADFKRGRTDTNDAERLARPNMIVETKLPFNRIRAITKILSDSTRLSKEVLYLVTRATEIFVKHICEQTYKSASDGTNILEYQHINSVMCNNTNLEFLQSLSSKVPHKYLKIFIEVNEANNDSVQ